MSGVHEQAIHPVTMGLLFYPRGGSAQVVRYLARALEPAGWDTSLACGSLGRPGDRTHAASFFAPLAPQITDYGAALTAAEQGRDPIAEPVPMHPSYEDRPGAPDRIFAAVSPQLHEHLAAAWSPRLAAAAAGAPPEVVHLHHLTPLHDAAARVLPATPVVTHLHGTELKMIARALALQAIAREHGTDIAGMAQLDPGRDVRWASWRFAAHWVEAMRAWARASAQIIAISPHDVALASELLGVEPRRTTWIPNGVDLARFDRAQPSSEQRTARWRRWLVEDPQGWREGGQPGSVRYPEAVLTRFADDGAGVPAPVLLFIGRFTEVKRIPLLIRAYARARAHFHRPAPLVIWGGFPGEFEGEHPHTVAERERVEDVFFVGWRGHSELGDGLACSDVMVMPSIDESFGQVFVEAMACGVPVIAANAGGPPSFINVERGRPNGWLVKPDSLESLAEALIEAVNDPAARAQRSAHGYAVTRRDFSWTTIAQRTAEVYERAVRTGP
ncbi:MAG: glycosyltransferase family 4 protein [Thermoleophilaceae bacterium]